MRGRPAPHPASSVSDDDSANTCNWNPHRYPQVFVVLFHEHSRALLLFESFLSSSEEVRTCKHDLRSPLIHYIDPLVNCDWRWLNIDGMTVLVLNLKQMWFFHLKWRLWTRVHGPHIINMNTRSRANCFINTIHTDKMNFKPSLYRFNSCLHVSFTWWI